METTAIVTALVLIQYIYFAASVGKARDRHGVSAPSISGDAQFERVFRAHQNTMEQLVLFLPSLWLFAYYLDPLWASGLGVMFIVVRQFYFAGYSKDATKRSIPFVTGMAICGILLLGGLVGAVIEFVNRGPF